MYKIFGKLTENINRVQHLTKAALDTVGNIEQESDADQFNDEHDRAVTILTICSEMLDEIFWMAGDIIELALKGANLVEELNKLGNCSAPTVPAGGAHHD